MELNGIANVHMKLMVMNARGMINDEAFQELQNEIFMFRDYLLAFRANDEILWHEFRDKYISKKKEGL